MGEPSHPALGAEPVEPVTAEPSAIVVTDLAPGVGVTRSTTVHNDSDVPVLVRYTQSDSGPLAEGPTPLDVTYSWSAPGIANCDGAPVVDAGSDLTFTVTATLPREADNTYQGLSATSVLAITTTEVVPGQCTVVGTPTGPVAVLPLTGVEVTGLVLTAGALVGVGGLLFGRRRRRGRA